MCPESARKVSLCKIRRTSACTQLSGHTQQLSGHITGPLSGHAPGPLPATPPPNFPVTLNNFPVTPRGPFPVTLPGPFPATRPNPLSRQATGHHRDTNKTPTRHRRDPNGAPAGHQRDESERTTRHLGGTPARIRAIIATGDQERCDRKFLQQKIRQASSGALLGAASPLATPGLARERRVRRGRHSVMDSAMAAPFPPFPTFTSPFPARSTELGPIFGVQHYTKAPAQRNRTESCLVERGL